jgi:serine O-acetyltransferase
MTVSLDKLNTISESILASYKQFGGINHIDKETLPAREPVLDVLQDLLALCFPGYVGKHIPRRTDMRYFVDCHINSIYVRLHEQMRMVYQSHQRRKYHETSGPEGDAGQDAYEFLTRIPKVRELIQTDVEAIYEGDPAAKSIPEVIICYPGVEAIAIHRLAHELYLLDVPLIPRLMTEFAHSKYGIDIHPGATIGPRFFIDHGTGVVIGETTVIGRSVKLYQGVTLGALSMQRGPHGELPTDGKRHPTLEDDVTVYANATILGGETIIGKGSIIGANVWLTKPVAPGSVIAME